MKVVLLAHTPTPEQTLPLRHGLCYSDTDVEALRESISQERAEQFVEMLAGFGHEKPRRTCDIYIWDRGRFPFVSGTGDTSPHCFVFRAEPAVCAQDHFVFVTPPAIAAEPELLREYENAMQQSIDSYNRLADALAAKYVPEFLAQGCTEKAARTKAEKKAIEDARYVLPNACETKMILTMNVRSLRNFFPAAVLQSGTVGDSGSGNGNAPALLRGFSCPVPHRRSVLLLRRLYRGQDELRQGEGSTGKI